MALRSSTFRKLDGFREEFFMYGEDVDLCFRAQRTGLINMFVPDAEVVHHGGCSSESQVSGFSATMQRAALERYFHLNCSRTSATGYRVLQAISALTRLALLAFPRIFSPRAGRDRAWLSMHKWMMVLKWAACQKLPMTSQRRRVTESVVSPEAVAFPEHPARAK